MVTIDVSKLIDGIYYLLDSEQYDELHIQLDLLIPLLIEQQQATALFALLERICPALLERQQAADVARYLQLVEPHVPKTNSAHYAILSLLYGHTYYVIEETERAVCYYREALSYFMQSKPINFKRISLALLNLTAITGNELSAEQQLAYARAISIFSSMESDNIKDSARAIVFRYATYFETCLRLERFDEANTVLQKMKQADCAAYSREALQIHAFETMLYYRQQRYDEALHCGEALLRHFPNNKNMTILSYIYTVLIDCAHALQLEEKVTHLMKVHETVQQRLELQRHKLHEQLQVTPMHTLENSTPLPQIATMINNTLSEQCYTLLIYDVSVHDDAQHDTLVNLHAIQLQALEPHVVAFTTLKSTQLLYVLQGDDKYVAAAIEHAITRPLPCIPITGYCHASHYSFTAFEQLLQMTYAHIYYAYSKQHKLS